MALFKKLFGRQERTATESAALRDGPLGFLPDQWAMRALDITLKCKDLDAIDQTLAKYWEEEDFERALPYAIAGLLLRRCTAPDAWNRLAILFRKEDTKLLNQRGQQPVGDNTRLAIRCFDQALQLDPSDWARHDQRGIACMQLAQFEASEKWLDEAELSLRRSIELNPQNRTGRRNLEIIQDLRSNGL